MKKIVILTTSGGGGHISASKALRQYLHKKYSIVETNIFSEILYQLDFVRWFSLKKYNGEDFYNYLVQKKAFKRINILWSLGKFATRILKPILLKMLRKYFKSENPDLIISVIPLLNGIILKACKELDIPFLVVPTDLDATTFIYGINNPDYTKFEFNVAFADNDIFKTIEPAHIDFEQLSVNGFPLRESFFEEKNPQKIKKEFNIETEKPIILLMMGAVGSKESYTFMTYLSKITNPAHIIICLGKNKKNIQQFKNLRLPNHISLSLLAFTEKISDLMSISDILITKSGTVTVCESIYMNLPLLLDATSEVLLWEQFNHLFVTKNRFGLTIKKYKELPQIVDMLLSNPKMLEMYKKNLTEYPKKNFEESIQIIIEKLISKK